MLQLPRTVISNCTTRKAAGQAISIHDVSQQGGALAVANRWMRLVRRTPTRHTARELYKGRSIADAACVAAAIQGRLFVVSAGLGLVAADDPVPNYDLTVARGSDLATMLARQGLGVHEWWAALTNASSSPVSSLAAHSSIFLALPATYLRLIREDLASITLASLKHVWIFTSEAGRAEVADRMAQCVMPYDDRLETVQGFDGTRADFPQRALRHFVENLRGHELSVADGRSAVIKSLSKQSKRELPERVRASDDEIRTLIRARWGVCSGSSTRLLRYLRDEAKVSCEQGRFRALWRSLKIEIEG